MAFVKLIGTEEFPEEGAVKRVDLVHPLTEYPYQLAVYHVDGRYFIVTDVCKLCGGNLSDGKRVGMFVFCSKEEHPWNVKTGILKYDRTTSTPTYRVHMKDDGIEIEI